MSSPPTAMASPGYLLDNLVLFGRLLRRLGLRVSPGRIIALVEALEHVSIDRRDDFYHAARCLLVQNQHELALFDRAFALFWRAPTAPIELPLAPPAGAVAAREVAARLEPAANGHGGSPDSDEEQPVPHEVRQYSARERLRHMDFAHLDAAERAAVRQAIAHLEWTGDEVRSRRYRPGRGRQPDFRRTLRRNLRYGGELMILARRKPSSRPRPIVLLADISGSMALYSQLLLTFAHGLVLAGARPVEVFVFGTQLTRITRQLRPPDVNRALDAVSNVVADWSGGTRIGQALRAFNRDWRPRVLRSNSLALIVSDGWDRGQPELMAREMGRLQRSCHRVLWLNPLLGTREYEPLTRGMVAALPFIDDFLPAHNLASLEELVQHLSSPGAGGSSTACQGPTGPGRARRTRNTYNLITTEVT